MNDDLTGLEGSNQWQNFGVNYPFKSVVFSIYFVQSL